MFSMCSELTPRAPILDSRIAQFMQPCRQVNCSLHADKASAYVGTEDHANLFMRQSILLREHCINYFNI